MCVLLRPPQPRLRRPLPRPRFRNQTFLQSRRRGRAARKELAAPNYKCAPIMLGANTDPYQPLEKTHKVTRSLLEVLLEHKHPVSITTKGALVARDVDLLAQLARDGLTRVMFSIPTLDNDMKRVLEPRAAVGRRATQGDARAGRSGRARGCAGGAHHPGAHRTRNRSRARSRREAGASLAGYTMLRLPWEVKDLFREWLAEHFPDRAAHVMSIVRAMRGERDNDPSFGTRMHATGPGGAADPPAFPARLPAPRVSAGAENYAADESFSPATAYSPSVVAGSAALISGVPRQVGNHGAARRGHKVTMLQRGILAAPIDIPHHGPGSSSMNAIRMTTACLGAVATRRLHAGAHRRIARDGHPDRARANAWSSSPSRRSKARAPKTTSWTASATISAAARRGLAGPRQQRFRRPDVSLVRAEHGARQARSHERTARAARRRGPGHRRPACVM